MMLAYYRTLFEKNFRKLRFFFIKNFSNEKRKKRKSAAREILERDGCDVFRFCRRKVWWGATNLRRIGAARSEGHHRLSGKKGRSRRRGVERAKRDNQTQKFFNPGPPRSMASTKFCFIEHQPAKG